MFIMGDRDDGLVHTVNMTKVDERGATLHRGVRTVTPRGRFGQDVHWAWQELVLSDMDGKSGSVTEDE